MENWSSAHTIAGVVGATALSVYLFLKYVNSEGIFHPVSHQLFGIGQLQYAISGDVSSGYENIREAFEQNYQKGLEIGSGLCVYGRRRFGRPVFPLHRLIRCYHPSSGKESSRVVRRLRTSFGASHVSLLLV